MTQKRSFDWYKKNIMTGIPQLYVDFLVYEIHDIFEECETVEQKDSEWIYEFSQEEVDQIEKKIDEFDDYYKKAMKRMDDLKKTVEIYKGVIDNLEELDG